MTFLRRCHNIRNQRIVEGKRDDDGRKAPARAVRDLDRRRARNYRDRKSVAIVAAEYLKWKYPHSVVVVKDLRERGGAFLQHLAAEVHT
jgi:hypothetical protein